MCFENSRCVLRLTKTLIIRQISGGLLTTAYIFHLSSYYRVLVYLLLVRNTPCFFAIVNITALSSLITPQAVINISPVRLCSLLITRCAFIVFHVTVLPSLIPTQAVIISSFHAFVVLFLRHALLIMPALLPSPFRFSP